MVVAVAHARLSLGRLREGGGSDHTFFDSHILPFPPPSPPYFFPLLLPSLSRKRERDSFFFELGFPCHLIRYYDVCACVYKYADHRSNDIIDEVWLLFFILLLFFFCYCLNWFGQPKLSSRQSPITCYYPHYYSRFIFPPLWLVPSNLHVCISGDIQIPHKN